MLVEDIADISATWKSVLCCARNTSRLWSGLTWPTNTKQKQSIHFFWSALLHLSAYQPCLELISSSGLSSVTHYRPEPPLLQQNTVWMHLIHKQHLTAILYIHHALNSPEEEFRFYDFFPNPQFRVFICNVSLGSTMQYCIYTDALLFI